MVLVGPVPFLVSKIRTESVFRVKLYTSSYVTFVCQFKWVRLKRIALQISEVEQELFKVNKYPYSNAEI